MIYLSPLYSDGMIIQRERPLMLAGRTTAGNEDDSAFADGEAAVTLCGTETRTQIDRNGAWRILLPAVPDGGPWMLALECRGRDGALEQKTLHDIYAGDVWFCGGQSNMELMMARVRDRFPEEWEAEDYPVIREFRIPQDYDLKELRTELAGGIWTKLSRATLDQFSAAAYFFAQQYTRRHKIAVGLLNASWGGCPAEAWTSEESVRTVFPAKADHARQYADDAVREAALRDNQEQLDEWTRQLDEADAGLSGHWEQNGWAAGNTADWHSVTLPVTFNDIEDLRDFAGAVYFRRTFTAPHSFTGTPLKLWLGTIVDADSVSINGIEVGKTAYRYPPRKYIIPKDLVREGENTIVIRVVCNNGLGEFTQDKPFELRLLRRGGEGDEPVPQADKIDLRGRAKPHRALAWEYRIGVRCGYRPPEVFLNREAYGLYNAMIHPAKDFPVKGVLYYQAESNDQNPAEYETLFRTLINDWRTARGDMEMPFVFVQLPVWGVPGGANEADAWAVLRDAQAKALSLPHTAMAVGLDAGEWNDLHPLDKKTIGTRLFLAVEKLIFGEENSSPGPVPESWETVLSGDSVPAALRIRFKNCAGGLSAKGDITVTLGAGNELVERPAVIEGADTLIVPMEDFRPERVLYAWANTPQGAGIYNTEGLPAPPFRIVVNCGDNTRQRGL